ncbi:MAG TPA: serine hydrolase domain-containing protein, partial [Acidimicrobiales bacterium]|nr:serine hydrolase domain-containing protein [Acidimicrobiales bacterium]
MTEPISAATPPLPDAIDPAKVEALLTRVRREVDEGLSPAVQIAVAHDGRVVVDETFGARADSRFLAFSATKALVAAAVWRLIDAGEVDIAATAASYVPEFASNGKDVVTVENLLTHTGGFPWAPLGPNRWSTTAGRREAFAKWRLTLDVGTAFMYHPTAGHWVLGEILSSVTGMDHTDAIEELVTAPLGLPRLLGIALDQQDGIQEAVGIGVPPTPEEMEEAYGVKVDIAALIPPDVALGALTTLNHPEARVIGVPGGGGIMRAADLALL